MPVKNIKEQKDFLRSKYKKLRENYPKDKKAELDAELSEKFLSTDLYRDCAVLFVYVSSEIEFDTSRIIRRALEDGKKLAVPKCRNKSGEMDFYYINSTDELEKGTFGILEPPPDKCERAADYSQGVCIVPGLCFDLSGYRIGFGKGYYDRFLQDFKGTAVGICYSRCVEKKIPGGFFDKPVDILMTERYTNYTYMFGEE